MLETEPGQMGVEDHGPSSDKERATSGARDHGVQAAAPRSWRLLAPVVLVLLVFCVFMPALDAGLVDWDDDDLLVLNTRHQTVNLDSLSWMFTTSYSGHFQPLTWLSYALDWAVWNRELFGYHFTNVLLHALTVVVVYFVARRLLTWTRPTPGASSSAPAILSAMFTAALFAVHPLRVESVAWLAERRDVLAGLFFVLAVACYLRYVAATDIAPPLGEPPGDLPALLVGPRSVGRTARRRRCFYAGAVALCAISLLAKASAVVLPLVLLILDAYPLRRWPGQRTWPGRGLPGGSGRPSLWLEKVPFFVLSIAGGVRALIAQHDGGWLRSYAEYDLGARMAQASYGLMFYMWKTVWPANLGPLYEIPRREVLFGGMLWVSIVVACTAGFATLALKRRFPAIAAALAVYVVTLFPVLGFTQSGPQLVADRYSYLSCLGLTMLGGALLLRVHGSRFWARGQNFRVALWLAPAFLVVWLSKATFAQADTWLSARTLWKRGVQVSPESPIAHTNYADALVRFGEPRLAAKHYDRALQLNPDDPVALHHFADLHKKFGQMDGAIPLYLHALQIDPNRYRAAYALAESFVAVGRPEDALTVLRDAAGRHPEALELVDYLARLLCTHPNDMVRNGDEATNWALQVNRAYEFRNVPALITLATAHADAGRFADAIAIAEKALALANYNREDRLVAQLNYRLSLFREGKPYRDRG